MKRIIKTELLKLPTRGNYILLIILLLIYIGFSYGFFSELTSSDQVHFINLGKQLLDAQFSLAGILISIFIITNVGKEYKDGTLRKNIIDGYTRNDFYTGKIFVLLLSVLVFYLLGLLCLFLVAVFSDQLSQFNDSLNLQFVLNFFLQLAYTALWAGFLIFLFRKLTISVVMFFVWGIVESVLYQLQIGLREKLNLPESFNIQEYLPRASIDHALKLSEVVEPKHLIITSVYILIFLLLPYYLFIKADIKS